MNKLATFEGVKEIGRWVLLFVLSWLITSTLAQVDVLPEAYNLKVIGLTYAIPVKSAVTFALTFAGRFLDKYRHYDSSPRTGIIPF